MLLLHHAGENSKQISEKLGCNVRAVQKWLGRFENLGLPGLVEEHRTGRSVSHKKLKAIRRFLVRAAIGNSSETVEQFSKRIDRSPDAIWRAARLFGLSPTKGIVRDLEFRIDDELAASGLVGLFLCDEIVVAAFQGSNRFKPLPLLGEWFGPPKKFLDAYSDDREAIHALTLRGALMSLILLPPEVPAKRAQEEIWKRWMNALVYAEPKLADSLTLFVTGNLCDQRVFKTLRLSHEFKPRTRSERDIGDLLPEIDVKLFVDRKKWLTGVGEILDDFSEEPLSLLINYWCDSKPSGRFLAWCRQPIHTEFTPEEWTAYSRHSTTKLRG